MKRQSGILLHITSLKNDEGIGTLGEEAFKFIDWLCEAKIGLWQVLPVCPTGYGDSPYASFSAFAGNPYLISINTLYQEEFISKGELTEYKQNVKTSCESNKVDYGFISYHKTALLQKIASQIFDRMKSDLELLQKFKNFCKTQKFWLEDFAIFMTIKEFYDQKAEDVVNGIWNEIWDKDLASHNPRAITEFSKNNLLKIEIHKIIQFLFFEQWAKLKKYAKEKNIKIVGDIPIFVAMDSVDVWAHQNLFMLDENLKPKKVAGVPPDFFSQTGQLWGNPLYDWGKMAEQKYSWWKLRFRQALKMFDIIRLDHFLGFEAFWAIPSDSPTAVSGEWTPGPSKKLFIEIKKDLAKLDSSYKNELPIIAEDLGVITEAVLKLRDEFNFPGMKILQFAFDTNEWNRGCLENPYLPHNIPKNSVVYTGTHDNDTLMGSLENYSSEQFEFVFYYIYGKKASIADYKKFQTEKGKKNFSDELVKLCFSSRADITIVQMQDILYEGAYAKMNSPSTIGNNWQWRQNKFPPPKQVTERLSDWNILYGRN